MESQQTVYCEIHDKVFHPYIPLSLKKHMINLYHFLSASVTDRRSRRKSILSSSIRDVAALCRSCLRCQTSKVSWYNKFKLTKFGFPDTRFQHIHADIVCPFPQSNRYKYTFTMVDQYTRWPEVVPMYDMMARTLHAYFFRKLDFAVRLPYQELL